MSQLVVVPLKCRRRERDERCLLELHSLSAFSSVWHPSSWDGAAHIQVGGALSSLVKSLWNPLRGTPRDVSSG